MDWGFAVQSPGNGAVFLYFTTSRSRSSPSLFMQTLAQ